MKTYEIVTLVCNKSKCFSGTLYNFAADYVADAHESDHRGHKVFAFYKKD